MPEPIQPRSEPNAPEPNEPEAVAAGVTAQTPTPTEPGSESGQATEVIVIEEPAPPRRRRRWIGWVIAAVVLVVLLVVAFFVADALARQVATAYVRERIIEVLKLPADATVDVDLGTGSLLLQAARGSVDDVTVWVPELTVGGITASAVLTAEGVPLSDTEPVRELGIVVTLTEEQVRALSGYLSGIELTSIDLERGVISVGTDLNVVFLTIPVTVDLVPSASENGISFEPDSITLDGTQISVADLRAIPLVSDLAGDLLASREFCIADSLPQALEVRDVAVRGSELVVQIGASGVPLSGPGLTATGECPAP